MRGRATLLMGGYERTCVPTPHILLHRDMGLHASSLLRVFSPPKPTSRCWHCWGSTHFCISQLLPQEQTGPTSDGLQQPCVSWSRDMKTAGWLLEVEGRRRKGRAGPHRNAASNAIAPLPSAEASNGAKPRSEGWKALPTWGSAGVGREDNCEQMTIFNRGYLKTM